MAWSKKRLVDYTKRMQEEGEIGQSRRRKKRQCLKCDKWFTSDDLDNRICPACRRENAKVHYDGHCMIQ